MDRYLTISSTALGEFKDRGSKFLAVAHPVGNRDSAEELLGEMRKEHFKARHHCLAYRIGLEEVEERASDDGEPSGSAGMPILNQIRSKDLHNLAVVVIRYFGGTKLGVSGLINAYKSATEAALENAIIIEREVRINYRLTFDYRIMTEAMNLVKSDFLHCSEKDLGVKGVVEIGFLPSEHESGLKKSMAILLNQPEEAILEPIYDHELFHLEKL